MTKKGTSNQSGSFRIYGNLSGLILASLKKEIQNDKYKQQPDWERFKFEDHMFETQDADG